MTTLANVKWYINGNEWWINQLQLMSKEELLILGGGVWTETEYVINYSTWKQTVVLNELNKYPEEYYNSYNSMWYISNDYNVNNHLNFIYAYDDVLQSVSDEVFQYDNWTRLLKSSTKFEL